MGAGPQATAGRGALQCSSIEPHRALELIDRGLRLALASERDPSAELELSTADAANFEANEKPAAESSPPGAASMGGAFQWDGPPRPKAKPLPWNGFQPPNTAMLSAS